MLLPPDLENNGYYKIAIFKKLNEVAFIEDVDCVRGVSPWSEVRNILEYLTCVEYSKSRLLNLPSGRALGSKDVTPARHDSAALVFLLKQHWII